MSTSILKRGNGIHIPIPIEAVPVMLHLLVIAFSLTYNSGKNSK